MSRLPAPIPADQIIANPNSAPVPRALRATRVRPRVWCPSPGAQLPPQERRELARRLARISSRPALSPLELAERLGEPALAILPMAEARLAAAQLQLASARTVSGRD